MTIQFYVLQKYILYLHVIVLYIFIEYGYEILEETLAILTPDVLDKDIKPDLFSSIAYIVVTLMPLLYLKGDNSALFSLFLLMGFGLMVILNSSTLESNIYISQFQDYIEILFMSSILVLYVYKQLALFRQIENEWSWFYQNWQLQTKSQSSLSICYNLFKNEIFVPIFCNVLLHTICFMYFDKINIVTAYWILHLIWTTIIPLIFYLLPSTTNKYDLYHHRQQMTVFVLSQTSVRIFCILWCFGLKYILPKLVYKMIINSSSLMDIFSLVLLPMIMTRYKNKQHQNKVHKRNTFSLLHNKLTLKWSEYVSLDSNKFQSFYYYLAKSYVVENLLFISEVMNYKIIIMEKLKIDINGSQCGYILELSMFNNNYTPILQQTKDARAEMIDIESIKQDLSLFYERYVEKTDGEQHDRLYASFIDPKRRKEILHSIFTTYDKMELLNVFDDAMKDIDSVLQLLYVEYVKSLP